MKKKNLINEKKHICLCMFVTYLNQVRFQIRMVAFVQTHVLIAMPVPNIEKRLIFSTSRLGLFLMAHSGIGLLVWWAMVTFASHLYSKPDLLHDSTSTPLHYHNHKTIYGR